jgi:putative drug exporter of the RND superfamily
MTARNRWLLPALLVVVWLGLGGWLGSLAGKNGEVANSGSAAYLPQDAEATTVAEQAKAFGASDSLPAVVVYARDPALTGADREAIERDRAAVSALQSLAAPPGEPRFAPGDRAAYLVVQFAGTDAEKYADDVDLLRETVQAHPGLTAHVTGPVGVERDLGTAVAGVDLLLVLVTGVVILIILIVVYRSPILPLLVLAIASTALGVAMGVIYLLARAGLLSMGSEVQGIFSVLVLGAGTDYALLLVARYREELHRNADPYTAMRIAWRNSLGAILASAATVAAALLCLLFSDLGLNRNLGPVGAVGIGCALITMLTLLPAVLVLLGRAAFWPRRPAVDREVSGGLWTKVAGLVGRRPRWVWVGTALVLGVMALGVLRLDANGLPTSEQIIGATPDSARGQRVLSANFPAGEGNPAIVITNADRADAVQAAALRVDGVSNAAQASPPVAGKAMLAVTINHAPDSREAEEAVRQLRDAVHAVDGAEAKVGGYTAVEVDFDAAAKSDRNVLPLLAIVVLLMLVLLLRSLIAPLLLMATVLLSYFAAIGVSAIVFQDIFGFPGADSTYPVHAFVFLVALGVDYNIFLMTRVREETERSSTRLGTLRALTVTGGVITSAGVVLAATFSALALIPLVLLVELAFTVAFGVLLDTIVVRSLLVPALTIDCGRWVWWPRKLARNSVDDVDLGLREDRHPGPELAR